MIRNRLARRAAYGVLALLVQPIVVFGAANPLLSILGAADGQMKLLAETAQLDTDITIESNAATEMKATFRVSPLRDAAGHLFPVTLTAAPSSPVPASPAPAPGQVTPPTGASLPAVPAQLPFSVPPLGAWSAHISAVLPGEGDYSGELIIGVGDTPVRVKLTIIRASRNLDVEVLGAEPARATASVFGSSSAGLQLALVEKTGRAVTLAPPVLVKLDRKGADGARFQAAPNLSIAGASSPIAIGPNSTTPLALTFSGLRGAGEYTGTIRFSAPGSKPVDQDFTLNLRESQWIAFLTIALGVIVSALLKNLGQNIRPRLVETRRAQLLVREIDELMSVPDRAPVEQAVLRSLRRSVVAVLLDLDGGPVDGVSDRLDRVNARRALAAVWLVRRGEVETLRPAALRDRFRTVLEQAQALIVDDAAAAAAVTTMDGELRELPARMNEAVRTELVAGIAGLRESLNALVARPGGSLPLTAPGQIAPILDRAEQSLQANDLRGALDDYERARRVWASLLIDDLDAVISGPRPFELEAAEWDALKRSLTLEVAEARRLLVEDPDAAVSRYNRGWALYVASVTQAVARAIVRIRAAARAETDLSDPDRAAVTALLTAAETSNSAARTAAVAGETQEAVAALETAIAKTREARSAATPVRAESASAFTAAPLVALSVPPALRDVAPDDLAVTEHDLHVTTTRIARLDFLVAAIAIVIAGLLGVRALWLPNLTWGGWDDHVIAVLWGLGLHQFTFAGIIGLTDRLVGTSAGV